MGRAKQNKVYEFSDGDTITREELEELCDKKNFSMSTARSRITKGITRADLFKPPQKPKGNSNWSKWTGDPKLAHK